MGKTKNLGTVDSDWLENDIMTAGRQTIDRSTSRQLHLRDMLNGRTGASDLPPLW